jgi:diguanylate cyclase (GGDEF)-like protein
MRKNLKFLRALDPVIWIAAALFVVAIATTSLSLWQIRYASISDVHTNNRTTAAILADQASQSIQAVDLLLSDFTARVASAGVVDGRGLRALLGGRDGHDFIKDRLGSLQQVDVITIVDSTGAFVGSSRPWPGPVVNLDGKEAFERQKEAGHSLLAVARTPSNHFSGEWMVYFSRRLETADGVFLGVVTAGVRPAFFLRLFEGLSRAPGAFARVIRNDGLVLANYPAVDVDKWSHVPADSPWVATVKDGGGSYRYLSHDGVARLVAVQPLERFPIVINTGVAEEAVLDLWRKRALVRILVSIVFSAALIALICILFDMYRKAAAARAQIRLQSEELGKAKLCFEAVLMNMKQGVAMFDAQDRLVVGNARYALMYGLTPEKIPAGTMLSAILDMRIASNCFAGDDPTHYIHNHLSHFDRNPRFDHSALEHLRDGRYILISHQKLPGGGWITTHEDVTERQTAAERIAHIARHDGLTDLENRSTFFERVEKFTRRDGATNFSAMILVDLDAFKAVNDTHGHLVGDELIKAVANRLRQAVAPGDIVARLGGDEFAILRPLGSDDLTPAIDLADDLLRIIRQPYRLDDCEVKVGLSIGVAAVHEAAGDPSMAMRNADLALYRAKDEGRNCYRIFESQMADAILARQRLAADLETALSRNALTMLYQPIVDARSLKTRAMEALAEWRHPTRGVIAAGELASLAEEAGLIERFGDFILMQACQDAAAWPMSVKIAVNVSAAQAARTNLVESVGGALHAAGLPPARLEIEITESVLLDAEDHKLDMLRALHAAGVEIVLDEFGAGVSSLSSLNRFPLEKIKIDSKFVSRLDVDAESTSIVAAMTSVARAFQARITAEGVETEAQRRLLQAAGIVEMQGDLFGAPREAADWIFVGGRADLAQAIAPAA